MKPKKKSAQKTIKSVKIPNRGVEYNSNRLLMAKMRFEREGTVLGKTGLGMIPGKDSHVRARDH